MDNKNKRRKTYTLDQSRSQELAQYALDLSIAIGKTVPKQTVLDMLVASLEDKTVYSKILKAIKNGQA